MSTRGLYLLGFALLLAVQSGCCCGGGLWPCGKDYCGSQCGQLFWHEWFSIPPKCCDPCSCCGNHCETGNPYVRDSMPPLGRPWNWAPDDDTRLLSGYYEGEGPPRQLTQGPSGGTQASAAYGRNEFQGYRASYNAPVASPGGSSKMGSARRLSDLFR